MPEDDNPGQPGLTGGPTNSDPELDPDNGEGGQGDPEDDGQGDANAESDDTAAGAGNAAPNTAAVEHRRVAPTFDRRAMTPEQRAALAERMFTDPIGVLDEYSAYREAQREEAAAATEFHYRDYERRAPEFFNEYAPAIRKAIALLPADQRADKNAVGYAILHAIGQDAQANGGDVIAAITRAAKQLDGAAAAAPRTSATAPQPAPSPKRQPDPPSVRTPAGGSTRPMPGGGSAAAQRRQPNNRETTESRLAQRFGKSAARELMLYEDE